MGKRPRTEVQSIVLHMKDFEDRWIPRKFEINSWVTIAVSKRGAWKEDAKKAEICAMDGEFKAQIKAFKFKKDSTVIESILVVHAYSLRQLVLKSKSNIVGVKGVNYIYPTTCQDWVDPQSITNLVSVLHADVGEATRGSRTHKQLLEVGIFFFNASYVPPTETGMFGRLKSIPLPTFDDPMWPVPDMHTSKSFRARIFADIQGTMKASTGSRVCSVHWYMPIHVMVDLFAMQHDKAGMHRTPTLFVFKPIYEDLFDSLMDKEWDHKIVSSHDIIKCSVLRESMVFRYHIGRETLYTTFGYVRDRLVGSEWVPMDQSGPNVMIPIMVELPNGVKTQFEVGQTWSISNLREEVSFYVDMEDPMNFSFLVINDASLRRPKKVNQRQEKKITIKDIGIGNSLRVVLL